MRDDDDGDDDDDDLGAEEEEEEEIPEEEEEEEAQAAERESEEETLNLCIMRLRRELSESLPGNRSLALVASTKRFAKVTKTMSTYHMYDHVGQM